MAISFSRKPKSKWSRVAGIMAKTVVIIFLLLLVLLFLLQTSFVQNLARKKIQSYLQSKLHSRVEIGDLTIRFPRKIILRNLYLADLRGDSLLAAGHVEVDISMFRLLEHEVRLNAIHLDDITAKISRKLPDTSFNFAYVIRAFSDTSAKTANNSEGSGYRIVIGKIHLHNISLVYRDDASCNDDSLHLGNLETTVRIFDPIHGKYDIPVISLSDLTGSARQYQPTLRLAGNPTTENKSPEGSAPVSMQLGSIDLHNINAGYRDETDGSTAGLQLGELLTAGGTVELGKMMFSLKRLELRYTAFSLHLGKNTRGKPTGSAIPATKTSQPSWRVVVDSLSLANNQFQFDDDNSKPVATGIDYAHLKISNLLLMAGHVLASPDEYSGTVSRLSLADRSGLRVLQVSAGFLYSNRRAALDHLLARTDRSIVRGEAVINYTSPSIFSSAPGNIQTRVTLDHTAVATKDLLLFVPALTGMFKNYTQSVIRVNGKLSGPLKNLTISQLEAGGLGQTRAHISGSIKGLPNANSAFYDIEATELATSKTDIEQLLPPGSIPSTLRIPASAKASGHFTGSLRDFHASLDAATTEGRFSLEGSLDWAKKSYQVEASSQALNLGYILKQDSLLGEISLRFSATGKGFDYKTLQTDIHGTLADGKIKGYAYKDLRFDGTLREGKGNWHASMHQPDIAFVLAAGTDFAGNFPALQLNLQLDTANLQHLHWLNDTLGLKLNLVANFVNTNPDSLQGRLDIDKLMIWDGRQSLTTDTISFVANRKDSLEDMMLHSESGDIRWTGFYKVTELPQVLRETINGYYDSPGFHHANVQPQNWNLSVALKPSPVLLAMIPYARGSDSLTAVLQLDSRQHKLDVNLSASKIQLDQQTIRGLLLGVSGRDSVLRYRLRVAEAGPESFHLNEVVLQGWLAHNEVATSLLIKDARGHDRYHLAGKLSREPIGFRFAIAPDSLLLNYDTWNVARDNFIHYDSSGLLVNHLDISNRDQSLRLSSLPPGTQSPLHASFSQFQVRTLTAFMNQDSLFLNGWLNGMLEVRNLLSHPIFTSDLELTGLTYKKDTIGNVYVKIDNRRENAFVADISLQSRKNQVKMGGTYYTGQNKTDININVGRFDLSLLKSLSAGQIKDIVGNLRGNLHASGNLSTPVLVGNLYFDSTSVTPDISGEPLKVSGDPVVFDKGVITLNRLLLTDSAGNNASITGKIYTDDYKNYRFDLGLKTRNFRAVNAPKEVNRLFYGKLNLDADMKIVGDMKTPKVNANLHINDKTDLTVTLPSSDPEEVSREGVVLFVDKKYAEDSARIRAMTDSLGRYADVRGLQVTSTIETDSNARFTMIIDERNGDALTIRGRADLAGGIDKTGRMNLTGNYELDNGSYNVSLSVLKRKFEIQRGSSLIWTGDPQQANINITASYVVNASPIDLVQQDLSGRSQDEINRYKQKLPFHVNLRMTGELLKPVLKFEITLPASVLAAWPEVDTRLQQIQSNESEVNKQVFALLLLNRFVQENPFTTATPASDVGLMARQSVSTLLTDQLNALAGSLIKGVDLSFDMNSDQSFYTGQAQTQTELNVAVSKNLFNDRVSVKVGSNFQLEDVLPGQSAANIAGDISVDYRLSKDGRYSLRAYRKDQYNTIVEGQVVETGLSFILTFDYNTFKELFQKTATKKQQRRNKPKTTTGNSNTSQ